MEYLEEDIDCSDNDGCLFEFANLQGRHVKVDDINFSFYFSGKGSESSRNRHSIRVKIVWNRQDLQALDKRNTSVLCLHGDYRFIGDPKIGVERQREARKFFQKYKVIFAACWEYALDLVTASDYLRQKTDIDGLLDEIHTTKITRASLRHQVHARQRDRNYLMAKRIDTLTEEEQYLKIFEDVVREFQLFNMND